MTAPDPVVVDLYKLGAELADRISSRRATANAFFLTAETTFIGVVALILGQHKATSGVRGVVVGAGVLLSLSWWLQLRRYRELNKAKFAVLTDIEQTLPVQLFASEWTRLTAQPKHRWLPRFTEIGTTERIVPLVFAGVWLLLLKVG